MLFEIEQRRLAIISIILGLCTFFLVCTQQDATAKLFALKPSATNLPATPTQSPTPTNTVAFTPTPTIIVTISPTVTTGTPPTDTPSPIVPTSTETPSPNLTTTAETQATQTTITQLQQTSTAIAATVEAMQPTQTAIAIQNATATARSFTPTPTLTPTPTPSTGAGIPLSTSTLTPIPTATPIPEPSLSAVKLIAPPSGTTSCGGTNCVFELTWSWDGILQSEQRYLVYAKYPARNCEDEWLYFEWADTTSHQVEPWLYNVMCPEKRTVRWTVYVAIPTNGLDSTERIPVSVEGEWWTFEWGLGGGSGPGPGSNPTATSKSGIDP